MKVPLSWLKDFIDVKIPIPELARRLTMLGLEVEEIHLVGLSLDQPGDTHGFKITGLSWDADKIVVAAILEVMPHPNADRLVLCRLDDGAQEQVILTGAPNLYPYRGKGPLEKPLKVAYAREGARIYDGHQPGQVLTTLKRAKIRGFESYSMVCSEKELGISDEHEGVIILDDDAPVGIPLADYMGDAVLEISVLPNMIRNACILGVAREIAAATGETLRQPPQRALAQGPSIEGRAFIEIHDPELNPRFVLGLIQGVEPRPSPYWVQRRLRLAGMRPINAIVDATNYVMLELGQPLHAFDYDKLVARAGGKPPLIITRTARAGEHLTTLDGVDRTLDDFTVLVCDTAGALSIAGVMGGAETEVDETTRNVLLEGASWNPINIRRTVASQKLNSEAAFRFARGVHPELAPWGVQLGLERMRQWGGGTIAQGMVDRYPAPVADPVVTLTPHDVRRLLGIRLEPHDMAAMLTRLEFDCRVEGDAVIARTPPHRLDIGQGVIGKADLLEEIARLYGYDRLPRANLADDLPPQRANVALEKEERVRDILVGLGLQEVVSYRLTTPEREARLNPPGAPSSELEYVRLANPISSERTVMRRSLLASVLEAAERNARLRDRLAFFEIGPVFLPLADRELPLEASRLAIVLAGASDLPAWDRPASPRLDFYDLKGILETLLEELHVTAATFDPVTGATFFHPGKCAVLKTAGKELGLLGELHPLVKERFDLADLPILAADLDLHALLDLAPQLFEAQPVPIFPPVLEDIAVVLDESVPAAQVEALIRQAGGKTLASVRLFDIYRGAQIGEGKKSLAYRLTYQDPAKTLTDEEAAAIRRRIVKRLEQDLGAKLRT